MDRRLEWLLRVGTRYERFMPDPPRLCAIRYDRSLDRHLLCVHFWLIVDTGMLIVCAL